MFRRIFTLSGLAIVGVVVSHAVSYGLWALYAWTDRYQHLLPADFDPYVDPFNTPQWYILMVTKVLANFCVPAFFFVSGFFISYAIDKRIGNVPQGTIKNRILGLIPPFIIWTVIFIAQNELLGTNTKPSDYVLPFLGFNGFWFIPTLIIFYLMSRGIVALAKKNWKLLLLATGIFQVGMVVSRYIWFEHITIPLLKFLLYDNLETLFVNDIFFFTFGVVVGMNSVVMKEWMNRQRIPILVTTVLLIATAFFFGGLTKAYVLPTHYINRLLLHLIGSVYSLFFLLTFLTFDQVKIPFLNWFTKVGSKTYGIYLTHLFFITLFSKLVYNFLPTLLHFQLLFTLLNIAVGIYGPLLIMGIARKIPVGKAYAYLFG